MNGSKENNFIRVETIEQLHAIAGLEAPDHPLLTIVDYSKIEVPEGVSSGKFICNFYSINYKRFCSFRYGRETFDHGEGTLHCTAPEQIISYDNEKDDKATEGWGIYFHPDLIRNTSLEETIHEYTFLLYNENEALNLTEDEEKTLVSLLMQIEKEYTIQSDIYSDDLIVSNIELVLNYCKRFYGRQFHDRSVQNKDVVARFEKFITSYINSGNLKKKGLPSVKYCASSMNLTPNYFSDLLKGETGKNTQEHIHYHVLEKAKSLLINTDYTVTEIAGELGFEYSQYFSKLFKKKVGSTPLEFRAS